MKADDFKNIVREIIREELQNLTNEDEYDRARDAKLDKNPTWGSNKRPWTPKKYDAPKTPAKTYRQVYTRALVATKIKYKDAEGKEHTATVASLLKYPKDHPGYKAAARMYASGMERAPKDEGICEGEGCLQEKSVPQPYDRKGARKMTKSQIEKRRKIGRDMMSNEKTASKFRKKYGDDWKDYIWAAASAATFRQSGNTKSNE